MHQQDGSCYFLHIGLNHCAKHLRITLPEKWTWPLSRCLCHQSFLFGKKEKKKKEIICLARRPPGAKWNISNHWSIRALVLMRKIDFVTFAISFLFLTSFSPGTSVIIQSLYSLLETPLGMSVYQPASWKNIVIRFTVRMYKYIHIRKGVSWSIWATITKYHTMGGKFMLVA